MRREVLVSARAFTFVEILAAMVFMAIVIPVTIQGITIANRAGVLAERSRIAAQLAENKLTEVILTQEWLEGDEDGDFGDDYLDGSEPRYRYHIESEGWEEDSMRLVTITVYYNVQDKEYSVTLRTLAEEEDQTTQ
jgi:type II secretory pathway pseudopilin PulG